MSKSDDCKNEPHRHQRLANTKPEYHERAGNQLDERNHHAHGPKRPHRQKRVGEGQEVFAGVIKWSELKNLHDSRHEENQTKDQARKQDGPGVVDCGCWSSQFLLSHVRFSLKSLCHKKAQKAQIALLIASFLCLFVAKMKANGGHDEVYIFAGGTFSDGVNGRTGSKNFEYERADLGDAEEVWEIVVQDGHVRSANH